MLRYIEHRPTAPLENIVRCVWTMTGSPDRRSRSPEPVVPDGCMEIVFHVGDPFRRFVGREVVRQPAAVVVGQMSGPTHLSPGGRVAALGIKLQPWGGRALLGVPMGELTDDFVPADLLLPGLAGLRERLAESPPASWPAVATDHLAMLPVAEPADARARVAVEALTATRGRGTVGGLARQLGVSGRTIERVMRREVGIPPQLFARILRLQSAIRRVRGGLDPDLGRTAVAAGYYDQAHFNREFRTFTDMCPSTFKRRGTHLTCLFLGDRLDRNAEPGASA